MKREILLHSLLTQYLASVEQRIEFLNNEKTCPPNMESYIASIIYCYGKVDVDEMGYVDVLFAGIIFSSNQSLKRNTRRVFQQS